MHILETQFELIETCKADVSELLTDKIDIGAARTSELDSYWYTDTFHDVLCIGPLKSLDCCLWSCFS